VPLLTIKRTWDYYNQVTFDRTSVPTCHLFVFLWWKFLIVNTNPIIAQPLKNINFKINFLKEKKWMYLEPYFSFIYRNMGKCYTNFVQPYSIWFQSFHPDQAVSVKTVDGSPMQIWLPHLFCVLTQPHIGYLLSSYCVALTRSIWSKSNAGEASADLTAVISCRCHIAR
jgi:hypothetical protein